PLSTLFPYTTLFRSAGREMIELINVSKRFVDNVVLDGVSLTVQEGETVALLGPSGVGKSVTLKTINGLLRPDTGDVIVDGLHVRSEEHTSELQSPCN